MEPPVSEQQSQLLFTPLMISMIGIASTALAIFIYHIILNKCCDHRRQSSFRRAISSRFQWSSTDKVNGLDVKALESIPIVSYSKGGVFGVDEIECIVCLSELEPGEEVRLLPNCKHAFHVSCIDEWFSSHSNCPVCRSPIVVSVDIESGHSDEGGSDDVDVSVESNRLRNSASFAFPPRGNKQTAEQPVVLKRSFSMDCSFVSLKIHPTGDMDAPSSSSSSSLSSKGFPRSSSNKLRSLRSFECASSMLSRLWSNNNNSTSEGNLPR